jgi:hypothetical protein
VALLRAAGGDGQTAVLQSLDDGAAIPGLSCYNPSTTALLAGVETSSHGWQCYEQEGDGSATSVRRHEEQWRCSEHALKEVVDGGAIRQGLSPEVLTGGLNGRVVRQMDWRCAASGWSLMFVGRETRGNHGEEEPMCTTIFILV